MAKIFDVQQIVRGKVPAGGRIYIGAYGSNPVENPGNVFTDENFTVSVATPLNLGVDGRPVDSTGQVLTLYAQDSYSMMIRDKYDADVLPTYWNVEVFDVDPDGNARVNIIQPEDGATGTSVGTTTNQYEWGYFDRINLTFTPGVGDVAQVANVEYVNNIAATKEDDLGNPGVDGYILSSTAAGVRSWIPDGGFDPTSNQNITGTWSFDTSTSNRFWVANDNPVSGSPTYFFLVDDDGAGNKFIYNSTNESVSSTSATSYTYSSDDGLNGSSGAVITAGSAVVAATQDGSGSTVAINGDQLNLNTGIVSELFEVSFGSSSDTEGLSISGGTGTLQWKENHSTLGDYVVWSVGATVGDRPNLEMSKATNSDDQVFLGVTTTGLDVFREQLTDDFTAQLKTDNGTIKIFDDGANVDIDLNTAGTGTAKYNGFEIATKNLEVVSDASATYILSAADNGKHIILTNAGAVNLQIDNGIDTGNGDSVGFNCLIETGNAATDISFTGTATKVNFNGDTKVAVGDGAMVTITSAVNNRYNFTGNTTV